MLFYLLKLKLKHWQWLHIMFSEIDSIFMIQICDSFNKTSFCRQFFSQFLSYIFFGKFCRKLRSNTAIKFFSNYDLLWNFITERNRKFGRERIKNDEIKSMLYSWIEKKFLRLKLMCFYLFVLINLDIG